MQKTIIILLLCASCVSPYDFNQDDSPGYLVVEGFVSNKTGDSEIKLSRSGIFQKNLFDWVSNAEVLVIENETHEHPFTYHDDGLYKPVQEDFVAIKESNYHLKIVLEGQVYESEQVHLQSSLDIDSLSFKSFSINQSGDPVDNPRLELQITTSDDEGASRYYMYTLEETWLAPATFSLNKTIKPIFIYDEDRQLINLDFETTYYENITNCWPSNKIVGINTKTTEGLSRNQLLNVPIFNVSLESPKLLYTYSVLVNQYAISRETHHFFNMLKEFSENSGYLYDIQPGFIEGNIHNKSKPEDIVIGTFYAATHSSSRTYKFFSELSREEKYIVLRYKPTCRNVQYSYPDFHPDSIPNEILSDTLQYLKDSLLTGKGLYIRDYYILEGEGRNMVVELSNAHCISCLVYGTNEKPDWWDLPL